jgi:fructose/tagatose bisphosphate aldolase
VPCCLFFNECPLDAPLFRAVDVGFNFVMLADPHATFEDYTQRVSHLVSYAHGRGAAVEAELGELPNGADGLPDPSASPMTDAEQAAHFIAAARTDILAVSVGNVHVLLEGELRLDLDRLAEIHQRLDLPLSLHGGTGIPAASLQEAIRLGVAKVAYGTYLKQRYLAALRKALGSQEQNPHRLLGAGGAEDVMVNARQAVRDAVLERIEFLGCCGKA